eukprot:gene23386-29601_t
MQFLCQLEPNTANSEYAVIVPSSRPGSPLAQKKVFRLDGVQRPGWSPLKKTTH